MNETVTYQWSEELSRASIRASYRVRIGRINLLTIGAIVLLLGGSLAYFAMKYSNSLVVVIVGGVFLLMSLKVRIDIRRIARDYARLAGDPNVTLTITEDSISFSSLNTNRTIQWSQLTKVKQSEGFLLLFAGILLVASIPLAPLSEQQRLFIEEKVGPSKKGISGN